MGTAGYHSSRHTLLLSMITPILLKQPLTGKRSETLAAVVAALITILAAYVGGRGE